MGCNEIIKIFLQNTEIKYLIYNHLFTTKAVMTAKLQLTLGFHNFFFAEYLILYTQYSVRQALKSTLIRKVTGIEINITMTCPD